MKPSRLKYCHSGDGQYILTPRDLIAVVRSSSGERARVLSSQDKPATGGKGPGEPGVGGTDSFPQVVHEGSRRSCRSSYPEVTGIRRSAHRLAGWRDGLRWSAPEQGH